MFTVLAAVAAVGLPAGSPAWAVAGDGVTDGNYGFVAKIAVGSPGVNADARSCSGALVSIQWVITSASCFPTAGTPSPASTVTLGRPDLTAGGGFTGRVTQVVKHPDRDVALLKLDSPAVGVVPVPLTSTAPQTAHALHVAPDSRALFQ